MSDRETELRKTYERLHEQFAPALRWEADNEEADDPLWVARLGPWLLRAKRDCWSLQTHFAPVPVLRWDDEHDSACLGRWLLEATSGKWRLLADGELSGRWLAAGAVTPNGDRDGNRNAAETALRAFGVAFRVEGDDR